MRRLGLRKDLGVGTAQVVAVKGDGVVKVAVTETRKCEVEGGGCSGGVDSGCSSGDGVDRGFADGEVVGQDGGLGLKWIGGEERFSRPGAGVIPQVELVAAGVESGGLGVGFVGEKREAR